ncbi:MAG TPA: carboxypeptidase-like regulatory domain-containing protein [Gemmatimonadaceae bacterium]|jgi:hypothetical protein|nr:carboxypeptidase-like regulatory domain-containing protein [Gemmatimonadaceae bacterium]
MTVPAQCDTVPPPLTRNEQLGGTIPHDVVAAADSGIVIGVVTEARSGRVLPYSGISLFRGEGDERVMVGSEKATDSLGGFVLGPGSPGQYTLRVRSMQHYLEERRLELQAGTVDTVRVAMRYFRCVGY